MTWLSMLIGVALNIVILRDMFHTLFAPSGSGSVSDRVVRGVWRITRFVARRRPDRLSLAGPLSVLVIILLWTLGIVVGWACMLWPHLPDAFLFSTGMNPDHNDGFLDAIYISLVTLATLGYGEITPNVAWLRLVAPLEALIGFSLFTASISWIMSIYPALSRQRHLAREISLLAHAQQHASVSLNDVAAEQSSSVLRDLASQVVGVRNDYVQFPIIYHFRTADPTSSLALALPSLVALGRDVTEHPAPEVRLSATFLLEAVEDLTTHLGTTWLGCETDAGMDDVICAYISDHLHKSDMDRLPERSVT